MGKLQVIIVLMLSCSLLLLGAFVNANVPPTPKAQSPVTVTITPTVEIKSGKSVNIVVIAATEFSSDNLRISIQAPVGMVLNSGSLSWLGSIKSGETKTLTFSGSFSDLSNQKLVAEAIIINADDSQFSARAEYIINKTSSELVNAVSNAGRTVVRGSGSVVEYGLDSK